MKFDCDEKGILKDNCRLCDDFTTCAEIQKERLHTQINDKTDFRKLVEPLVEYIRKNYSPHTRIIIDYDSAEIVTGIKGEYFEYFSD